MRIEKVAVLGGGLMGSGIAESVASAGLPVTVRDVDEVAAAQPEIDQRTEQLVSKGRWAVPGYKASPHVVVGMLWIFANNRTGEVRRSFRLVNVPFSIAKLYPTWVVSPTYCE